MQASSYFSFSFSIWRPTDQLAKLREDDLAGQEEDIKLARCFVL